MAELAMDPWINLEYSESLTSELYLDYFKRLQTFSITEK